MMAGRSRERPAPTTKDTSAVVTGEARGPSSSSTMRWRRSPGMAWSESVVRSSSLASSVRATRNSSSSTVSSEPSALATSKRAAA